MPKTESFNKHRTLSKMMNKKQYNEYRARLNELEPLNRQLNSFRGTFRQDKSTDPHEDKKYELWKDLRRQGHDVITEAIFIKGRGRCDIIDLTDGTIFEVLHSESKEDCILKASKYPMEHFKLIMVEAK